MRHDPSLQSLDTSILATVAYTDQFHYPLSTRQIWQRLITKQKVSLAEVTKRCTALGKNGLLDSKKLPDGQVWWSLPHRKSIWKKRIVSEQRGHEKWLEAQTVAIFLHHLPWVSGVVVTGSVAMGVASPCDDIDFMIITLPGRLWLTRFVVMIWASLKGKRRSWQGEEADSWCFNLWLDENHLAVPQDAKSLYAAYEVFQTRWIWANKEVYEAFFAQNAWYRRYLGQAVPDKSEVILKSKRQEFLGFVWYSGNLVLAGLQWLYMWPHRTRERVGWGFAYFHPRDTRMIVEERWQRTGTYRNK